MSLSEAIAADRNGQIELAAAKYEDVLRAGEVSLKALLNLAGLYWQATETGLAAAKHLSGAFMDTAWRRCRELLEEAERQFPNSTEVRFWKRYVAWADLNEPFDIDDCRRLLLEDPTALVPAMRVFDLSHGREAKEEAVELLRQCREEGTTLARYVASVIEAGMKHFAHPR